MNPGANIPEELDPLLLKKALGGDRRAFTHIVRQYEQTVYSFAFKVCRDPEKASDALQDTFVNVFRKLNQFDGKSKFTTWLYTIVMNICRMKHRRSKLDAASISLDELLAPYTDHNGSRSHSTEAKIQPWKSTPLDRVMDNETRELLDAAIQKLPLDYRVVFVLRDVEGRSAEETGKILKLSVPAVKSRLRRARVFLRERLDEHMKP